MCESNKTMNDSLKRRHFSKLHERIQNKYEEMQRRLQKSKSVDSITSLNEDYVFIENKHSSSTDVRDSDSSVFENIDTRVKHCIIVEEINHNDSNLQYVRVTEVSQSELETTPKDKTDSDSEIISNRFFGDDYTQMSLESLNEVAIESDEYQPSPTPPPINSIRNKIGSRISAVKEKRRLKEKERNTTKDVKKDSREKVEKFILSNTKESLPKFSKKTKEATVTIALIEATGLESIISEDKSSRIFHCRFRLGPEKYKSKLIKCSTSEVKWQELFNLNLFDDNIVDVSLWEKDFCIGRNLIDLTEMEKEKTHKMRINLETEVRNSTIQIFILLTISGNSLANTLVDLDDYQETQRELATIKKKFAWYHLKNKISTVGKIYVIVYGAKGLSNYDCCCVLQLDNERLQTHTEFKTNEPNWMKIFTFDVTDVTSVLELTVYDEKKSEDVGKISIPLLRIKNEEKKWYALKDAYLRDRARGNNPRILVEINLVWNLISASLRVINPKEINYLKTSNKVDRHIFSRNLSRAKVVLNWILNAQKVFKTFLEWESCKTNTIALIVWLLFCWFFKIWMLPLLLLIPFAWYRPPKYTLNPWRKDVTEILPSQEEAKKEEKQQTLRQRINSLQEMVQTVQNFIGEFANIGESIKNLFNFTVPFLSYLAIFLIVVIAFVMFMIPTKYIFMIWGIHKFTRKILRPNRIPNNEILDLLSRVPNDEILSNCEEIPLEEVLEED